jgi:hypothetical protein
MRCGTMGRMNTYEELSGSLRALVDREQRRLDRKPRLTPHDRRLKEELAALSHELDDPPGLDGLIDTLDQALDYLRQLQYKEAD